MEETKKLVRETSRDAEVVLHVTDISDDTSVKAMVDDCLAKFGRIDFACNNAGIAMSNVLTADMDMKTFDKIFDVNLKGVGLSVP